MKLSKEFLLQAEKDVHEHVLRLVREAVALRPEAMAKVIAALEEAHQQELQRILGS